MKDVIILIEFKAFQHLADKINEKAKIGRSYVCLPCSTNIMRGGSMGKKASKLHIINRSAQQ